MSEINSSSRVNSIEGDYLPRREEWALIYQHKAKQYERLKQMDKVRDREKKTQFKRQLDSQIHGKNDVYKLQKEQDKRYYDFITRKSQQMKQKQEQQKYDKMLKRKFVQEQNKHVLEKNHQRSRSATDHERFGPSFDIGLKSELDTRRRQQLGKRTMLDALDQQLHVKQQQKRQQRMDEQNLEQANNKYQNEYHMNRNRGGKHYGQNPNVYNYYQQLAVQKVQRERQLDHRLVDEAAGRKAEEEYRRKYYESQRKNQLNHEMKETLDEQVKIHNYKKAQQHRVNPEEHSYSVIGTMFKQKVSPYDKKQYSEYLRRQADEQKRKKQVWNHMSQEEYRLNLNQLNKAITGNYAHQGYQDRSLTAIGEKESKINATLADTGTQEDHDTDIVKRRMENIMNRRRPEPSDNNQSNLF